MARELSVRSLAAAEQEGRIFGYPGTRKSVFIKRIDSRQQS